MDTGSAVATRTTDTLSDIVGLDKGQSGIVGNAISNASIDALVPQMAPEVSPLLAQT